MNVVTAERPIKYTVGGTLLAGLPLYTLLSVGLDSFLPAVFQIGEFFDNHSLPILAVNIYMLFWGIGQLFWGGIIEKIGMKPVALFGIILYTFSSFLISTVDQNQPTTFILFRALQSLGGSGCYTAIFALIRVRFDGDDLHRSYSYLNGIIGFIPVSAPLIGAYILESNPWLYLFTIMAVMGLISLAWVALTIPADKRKVDASEKPASREPVIKQYWSVISNTKFRSYLSFALVGHMLFIYYLSVAPTYLIGELGVSQIDFGKMFMIIAVIFMSVSFIAPKLGAKLGIQKTIGFALLLCTVGGILMLVLSGIQAWYMYIVPMAIIAIGNTLLCSCSPASALADFKETAGVASGIYTALTFGAAAVIATVLTNLIDSTNLSHVSWVYIATSVLALVAYSVNKTLKADAKLAKSF